MKLYKIIFFVLFSVQIAFLFSACNGNKRAGGANLSVQTEPTDTAKISFTEYEHDFGKIAEGEKVACIFKFENIGKGPLVILSVTSSCGCTVPKYDSKPIAAGGSGIVEVLFDTSGRSGKQTKTITVRSNASTPMVLLRISGEVITSTNN